MLTNREIEVLSLICEGYKTPELAKMLFVTTSTIKAHTASIFRKLNAKTRAQAVRIATLKGIV